MAMTEVFYDTFGGTGDPNNATSSVTDATWNSGILTGALGVPPMRLSWGWTRGAGAAAGFPNADDYGITILMSDVSGNTRVTGLAWYQSYAAGNPKYAFPSQDLIAVSVDATLHEGFIEIDVDNQVTFSFLGETGTFSLIESETAAASNPMKSLELAIKRGSKFSYFRLESSVAAPVGGDFWTQFIGTEEV